MFEIEFEWPVASQYVLRPVERAQTRDLAIYVADDATITLRRPLEQNPGMYAEFAALDGSEKSCLHFASKYGQLVVEPHSNLDPSELETLTQWKGSIEYVKDIINRCEIGRARPGEAYRQFGKQDKSLYGGLQAYLSVNSPTAPPSLGIRCGYLLAAIELQAITSILGGRKSLQCIECSSWFEIGRGARRSQSKFCSTGCKDTYHNRLKAQARR